MNTINTSIKTASLPKLANIVVSTLQNDYGSRRSYLEIVKVADNFPHNNTEESGRYTGQLANLCQFFLPQDPRPHGYLLSSVVQKMSWTSKFRLDPAQKEVHLLQQAGNDWHRECNTAMDELLDLARVKNVFPKLERKRDEKYPIVGAKFPIGIERSASALLGIVCRGVHMTVYTHTADGIKFWIARRNLNKVAFPGKLDNAVAGGVAIGEDPFYALVREAEEETDLSEDFVRANAKACGDVSWIYISNEHAGGELGLITPGITYVYDLEIEPEVVLKPVDGDIHEFLLMDLEDVKLAIENEEFKLMCANVMLDFMIRHGYITEENEALYEELVESLHRKLHFPTSPI